MALIFGGAHYTSIRNFTAGLNMTSFRWPYDSIKDYNWEMRVAMLSYHTCPLATLGGKDTGGMNVYVRDLTRQFGRMGVQVDVYTRSQDEHVPHVLHDLGYGNRVVHVPAGPEIPLAKEELVTHVPAFAEWILDFAESKGIKYDVIHSHYWMSGLAAEILKSRWDIPIVQMFHTLGKMKNRVGGLGEVEGEYRLEGEKQVLKIADRIVAATPAEYAQLQWLYRADTGKIVIVPPGVDTTRFYPIARDEAKDYAKVPHNHHNILFVGRIEPLKGIDVLIRALAMINKVDSRLVHPKHFCVAIIGGDPEVGQDQMTAEMSRLHNLREQVGVGDMVTFLGKRNQDSLVYYYSAADAVVMPSHYESFGMVALEAMACGAPVIATEVGGLAYLVKEDQTGFLIPDDDPEALCDRLMRLMTYPDLQRRLSENAVDYAQGYAWPIIAGRLLDMFEQVIES